MVGEVIADAMTHIDRSSARHKVTTVIADDYLMAYMDARLIEQVLINLVNNAVKYTPAGSTICVSAASSGGSVLVSFSDAEPHGAVFTFSLPEVKTDEQGTDTGR